MTASEASTCRSFQVYGLVRTQNVMNFCVRIDYVHIHMYNLNAPIKHLRIDLVS